MIDLPTGKFGQFITRLAIWATLGMGAYIGSEVLNKQDRAEHKLEKLFATIIEQTVTIREVKEQVIDHESRIRVLEHK